MREAYIEAWCRKETGKRGGLLVKLAPLISGLPDDLLLMPGGAAALIEFKTPSGRLNPRQVLMHEILEKIGFPVTVVRSTKEYKVLLDRMEAHAVEYGHSINEPEQTK